MNNFDLHNGICVITGGLGLLGVKHAEAIVESNGIPILLDIDETNREFVFSHFNITK